MKWIPLNTIDQLTEIKLHSAIRPQIIFKHSTRCSISSMALSRLERESAPENADFYLLDLLQNRAISNEIAEQFQIHHESPQILVIKEAVCVYDESHQGINMQEIAEIVSA